MKMHDKRALKVSFMGKHIASHAPLFSETEEAASKKVAQKTRRHASILAHHVTEYNVSQIFFTLGI